MNILSYSIFGHGDENKDSFSFRSYLRGLEINLRVAEVLYPGWQVQWSVDEATYNSEYEGFFISHLERDFVKIVRRPKADLCEMMLWRMLPAFNQSTQRFICRDTDSLITYRDRQAVAYWENSSKVCLAITDSISHNVALMGGMVGFQAGYLRNRINCQTFEEMIAMAPAMDYTRKGSDQDFLNRKILPLVADSITEFYVLGLPQSFRGDCHNVIPDLQAAPDYCRELDSLGFHLGAAGYQETGVLKWLAKYGKNNDMYHEIEKQYSSTFYWTL